MKSGQRWWRGRGGAAQRQTRGGGNCPPVRRLATAALSVSAVLNARCRVYCHCRIMFCYGNRGVKRRYYALLSVNDTLACQCRDRAAFTKPLDVYESVRPHI